MATKPHFDIKKLQKYEENNRIEIKRAKGGLPSSVWETYSAFANTEGGIILLGVEEQEDHSLLAVGVDDAHKMIGDFWNMVNNRQKVSLNILTERMVAAHEVEGKTVVSIEVPMAERHHRPMYVGTDPMRGTYRRSFEGDYLCSKEDVASMYRDASDVSLDQKVLHTMDMSAFDMDTVRRYRNRFAQFHSAHIWNDDDDELFLRHIGAIALSDADMTFHPTCAGLLMFGHEYDIVREYPHYFLDYQERMDRRMRWTDRLVSTSGDWSGNLYDFFFRVYPRLTSHLPVPFVTRGISRQDDTPLHLALREVLLNALAHSDFYGRQGVVIIKSRERLTFANPGNIRIGLKAALAGGVSDPRNETIMKMFSLIDIGERAGTGIHDFLNVWGKYALQKPEYIVLHNPERTQLTIELPEMPEDDTQDDTQDDTRGGTQGDTQGAEIGTHEGVDGTQGDTQGAENDTQVGLNVPQGTANIPQDVPQGGLNVPLGTANVPQDVPQGTADVPQDVPQGGKNVLQSTANVPQGTADVPQRGKNVPQGTANVPQGTADVPQGGDDDDQSDEIDVWIEQQVIAHPKITTERLAILSGLNAKTIKRRIAKMPHIKYVGSGYSGHWEVHPKKK